MQTLEFLSSLGVFGYIVLAIIAACMINIKKAYLFAVSSRFATT